jgi:hypothetical protein
MILTPRPLVHERTIPTDVASLLEDEIKRLATRYLNKLPAHNSDQVRQLNNALTERRRLKRQWPTDLSLA